MVKIPDSPPEFWTQRSRYTHVPIDRDGPVARWAERLVRPYGYTWSQVTEWRWVGGEIPFAQFVCRGPDGGRDWLTITYVDVPPTAIDERPTTRLV